MQAEAEIRIKRQLQMIELVQQLYKEKIEIETEKHKKDKREQIWQN